MPTCNRIVKTVVINGYATTFESALIDYFTYKRWNVAAVTLVNLVESYPEHTNAISIKIDPEDSKSIAWGIEQIIDIFGRIDVVINNVSQSGLYLFEETTEKLFRKQFERNFFNILNVIRAVLPIIRKQQFGHIVNLVSAAGRLGIPLHTGLCSGVHALRGFTDALQHELTVYGAYATAFEVGTVRSHFSDSPIYNMGVSYDRYDHCWKSKLTWMERMFEKILRYEKDEKKTALKLFNLVNRKNPPAFYRATIDSKAIEILRRIISNKCFRHLVSYSLYRDCLRKYWF